MATSRTGTGHMQGEPGALFHQKVRQCSGEATGWLGQRDTAANWDRSQWPGPEGSEQNQQESMMSLPKVQVSESTLRWLLNFKRGENRQFCREFQMGYVAAWPARRSVLHAPPVTPSRAQHERRKESDPMWPDSAWAGGRGSPRKG